MIRGGKEGGKEGTCIDTCTCTYTKLYIFFLTLNSPLHYVCTMYMYMYVKHLYMYFFNACCIERNNRFKMPLLTNLPTSLMYMYICKWVCTGKTITIGITQQSKMPTVPTKFSSLTVRCLAFLALYCTCTYMYTWIILSSTCTWD